ncbi:DMT family transporter [Pseudoalteromonas shioyasakiensis]|uniref:DMT family transporter n=1 Tax=Pseudoalteromonas TaxID=53246 RepID=UPI0014317195|nr:MULTISPECIES: EamA family transporter [Pseudoalteromonas]HIM96186.1 EamA family transporter [Gammaproteobacteria bacterium]MCP4588634.1 EamA family transporter [Pseudoalteromonas sp.]MCQ8882015.1 DMT family transporter [Pseudoalteromonas shioyasakiensis]NIZ05311.1 EamA family transporter [Pseudoalteromonas sp. HF66]QWV03758.1 DMT family transporter [Pseudoalteromonas shioyasakiensis]
MNIILAMIPAFLWGTTYAVTKYATPDWPPLLLGALRALPAGLLLLLLKPSLPTRSQWPSLLTLGAVNIALFFAFIFIMAVNLPAAIAGVGMVSVPVVALLYAWLAKGQRPAKVQAFCAMALVVLAWLLFDPAYVALNVLGVAALFGALLTIVIGSTLVQSLSVHIHWWVVLTWQLIIGGSLLLLAAFIDGSVLNPEQYQVVFEPISALQYTALFWLIVPNTAIAYTLYVWLLGRMSVAEFSFGTIANPIAGIVCAVVLINEQYQDWQYLLMFLMIIFSVLPQMLKLRLLKQQTS